MALPIIADSYSLGVSARAVLARVRNLYCTRSIATVIFDVLTNVSVNAYTNQVEVRFSRHAKNKLRLYRLAAVDIEQAIESGEKITMAEKFESQWGDLRVIWLMAGAYALVVTVVRTR